jgi:hypothetical protein
MCAVRLLSVRVATLLTSGALLAGCGAQAATGRSCIPPPAGLARTTQGTVSASASPASVQPGGSVAFTVTVTGPAQYSAPCTGPVQLLVADSTQLRVFAASADSSPASPCGAVTLRPGRRVVYSVVWQVDPTLPYGRYDAQLVVGYNTDLQLAVSIAAPAGSC